jgi:hypothetical protein
MLPFKSRQTFWVKSLLLNDLLNISKFRSIEAATYFRRSSRIRTVQGILAFEGDKLNLDQMTASIDGNVVMGKQSEIQEGIHICVPLDNLWLKKQIAMGFPRFDLFA